MSSNQTAFPPQTLLEYFAKPGEEDLELKGVVGGEEALYTPEHHEWRDAAVDPSKALGRWREELDALLAGGRPYGKICSWPAVDQAMKAWAENIRNLPATAAPRTVYAQAPEMALTFLGY